MERDTRNHYQTRGSTRMGVANGTNGSSSAAEADLPNWGNRKRLRCIKLQRKGDGATEGATVANFHRGALNLGSPSHEGILRNVEDTATPGCSKEQKVDCARAASLPEREGAIKGSNSGLPASSDDRKGSSSGSEGFVWPKFAVALANKEKEEDFLIFKGSKLPIRPKKRAKLIQKTVNLVCPGTWLSDLTLERYQVREKKATKKVRPKGLKAMQNCGTDSE